jgi:hypothetical protein
VDKHFPDRHDSADNPTCYQQVASIQLTPLEILAARVPTRCTGVTLCSLDDLLLHEPPREQKDAYVAVSYQWPPLELCSHATLSGLLMSSSEFASTSSRTVVADSVQTRHAVAVEGWLIPLALYTYIKAGSEKEVSKTSAHAWSCGSMGSCAKSANIEESETLMETCRKQVSF